MMISSIVSLRTYNPMNVSKTPNPNSARASSRCNPKGNLTVPVLQTSNPVIVWENNWMKEARRSLMARKVRATREDSPADACERYNVAAICRRIGRAWWEFMFEWLRISEIVGMGRWDGRGRVGLSGGGRNIWWDKECLWRCPLR